MATYVNLNWVLEMLDSATVAAEDLNGSAIPEGNQNMAGLTRDLLNLADSLALASAVVRDEYWRARGGTHHQTGEAS